MISYSKIIREAYKVTVRNPIFWLFGLFLAGGFNLNFLHFQNLDWTLPQAEVEFYRILFFFQSKPEMLTFFSLGLLFGTLLSLFLTNWSKIMLVLGADTFLEKKSFFIKQESHKSLRFLCPVIKVSLITSGLLLSAAVVLLVPPVFFVKSLEYQTLFWLLGALVFLPLAFTVSCLNIFGSFFIVEFKVSAGKALDLATDLFATCWTKIFALAVILMLIYAGVFVLGVGGILFVKFIIGTLVTTVPGLGNLQFFGMIMASRIVSGILLWVLVAGLNVFFSTALLLLFKELIEESKHRKEANSPVHVAV
ncbi:MAG: hypothetical protein COT92_01960 [Candidatus Doudnabacteria bacterium CG10_big_fil_rev_8_21_14_0_10_42_18]|uniref:Glycerophosphoryl diester phosphodiesterase membrane domain-containing protein n=1 Tax=Candidatus Doudnabacteria bacterium CG10_big_fil_rev_8_21_14_0_10_42_18 TaxID=1974552 RepID=A0A2H0VD97_9BACT|nr:MAG: hypothetical protein COT92_01960 [Candidatus Doudnabacteria bacterium CG10_big_fil_rev_8_21_14_0_10_42_18]